MKQNHKGDNVKIDDKNKFAILDKKSLQDFLKENKQVNTSKKKEDTNK